jgi:hypothetical protein
LTCTQCTVGWVDIGTSTWVPLEFIHFYVKVLKTAIKSFLVKWPFEERGQALYKGQKFFPIIWGLCISKDAEFNVDFKNINLPLWQNAPKKSYSR